MARLIRIGAIGTAVLIVFLIAGTPFMDDFLFERGFALVQSSGYSMMGLPEKFGLPVENINLIRLGYDDIQIGDIVMYYSEHNHFYVTHRVVSIDYSTGVFVAQGDNPVTNPLPDPESKIENIVGEVVEIFGKPVYFNSNWLWICLFIAVFIGLHDVGEEGFRDSHGEKNRVIEAIAICVTIYFIILLGRMLL